MKKLVFLGFCTVSLITLTSCGSTAPCGLANNTKQVKQITIEEQQEVVADASVK